MELHKILHHTTGPDNRGAGRRPASGFPSGARAALVAALVAVLLVSGAVSPSAAQGPPAEPPGQGLGEGPPAEHPGRGIQHRAHAKARAATQMLRNPAPPPPPGRRYDPARGPRAGAVITDEEFAAAVGAPTSG